MAKRPAYWNLKKLGQFQIIHIYSLRFIDKYWPFNWLILQRAVAVWDFEKLVFRSWKTEIPVVSLLPGEENIIVLRKKIAPSPYCMQYYKYNSWIINDDWFNCSLSRLEAKMSKLGGKKEVTAGLWFLILPVDYLSFVP